MYIYKFPMVSATATILPIDVEQGNIVVGIRSRYAEVFPKAPCLPGGFLNASYEGVRGETIETTAQREFREEMGVSLPAREFKLFAVYSDPLLDPRAHVVNVCFAILLENRSCELLKAGDDLEGIEFVNYNRFIAEFKDKMAFNHYEIALKGLKELGIV